MIEINILGNPNGLPLCRIWWSAKHFGNSNRYTPSLLIVSGFYLVKKDMSVVFISQFSN